MQFGSVFHKFYEENVDGRDFVVGDLHGSVGLLRAFMRSVSFDLYRDRIFSVGDLVDRGTHSFDTLKLIDEPWFHAVLGNHEQMLYSFVAPDGVKNHTYASAFFGNGGNWVSDYDVRANYEELTRLTSKLVDLPRVITIKGKNKVHIVHAEFHLEVDEDLTDDLIENEESLKRICTYDSSDSVWGSDGDTSFWGRRIFSPFYNIHPKFVGPDVDLNQFNSPNLSTVVCGHTIVKEPILAGKILNIDTGAWFFSKSLTAYEVKTGRILQIDRSSVDYTVVDPYIIPIDNQE